MQKRTLAALGALTLASTVGLAACEGRGHGEPPNPDRVYSMLSYKVDDVLEDLEATPAQSSQVNALKDSLFNEAQTVIAGNREAKDTLRTEWTSATPDAQKVHQLVDARADAMRAFAHKAADAVLELHRVLTPEQRTALQDQLPQRR